MFQVSVPYLSIYFSDNVLLLLSSFKHKYVYFLLLTLSKQACYLFQPQWHNKNRTWCANKQLWCFECFGRLFISKSATARNNVHLYRLATRLCPLIFFLFRVVTKSRKLSYCVPRTFFVLSSCQERYRVSLMLKIHFYFLLCFLTFTWVRELNPYFYF